MYRSFEHLIKETSKGLTFSVKVQPGAKQNSVEFSPEHGLLKIRLKAKAQEGKANKALIEFMAKTLGIVKRDIQIIKGASSRQKVLRINKGTHDLIQKIRVRS